MCRLKKPFRGQRQGSFTVRNNRDIRVPYVAPRKSHRGPRRQSTADKFDCVIIKTHFLPWSLIVNKKQQNLSELVTRPENQQTATPLRPDKTATERQLLSNKSLMTATPPHPDSKPVEVTAACLLLLRLRRSPTATPHPQDKAQSWSGLWRNQI